MSATTNVNIGLANKATSAAKKRLIAAHQGEYNQILGEERQKQGLPANQAEAKLRAAKSRLEKQLAEINAKLG